MQVDVLGQPSLALHITYYILHLTYLNNASGCSRANQFGITYYILHIIILGYIEILQLDVQGEYSLVFHITYWMLMWSTMFLVRKGLN